MKQISFLILFLLGIGLFSSFVKKNNDYMEIEYTVVKIDSIKNWFLIYATRNDSTFKIVSIKTQDCECQKISTGKRYRFELQKRIENVLSKEGLKIIPMNYSGVSGVSFDQNTDIFMPCERDIYGLYSCKNLKGLCYE